MVRKQALAGLFVTSLVLGTGVPTAFAAASQAIKPSTVQVDGKTLSHPYQVVSTDAGRSTTYMPLYYVEQALVKAGYRSQWNGATHTWALTTEVPNLDFSQITVGSGNTTIQVNGNVVKKINTLVRRDPAGGPNGAWTTYVPIYYVQALFDAAGIDGKWNGTALAWTVTTPLTLATDATFGPSSGMYTLTKNVNVLGTNTTLQNVTVNGNVYVNPGENGSVYLKNVKVTGSIVVLSGAPHSIHFDNVTAPLLQVASSTNVHITAEGKTVIASTNVSSGDRQSVILDQISGTLGAITVHANQSVTLSGSQPYSTVTVTSAAKLTVDTNSSVQQLAVEADEAAVTVSQGATVTGLTVDSSATGVNLTNNGQITTLTNNAPSDSLTVQGEGTVTTETGNTPTTTTPPSTGTVAPTPVAAPLQVPSDLQVASTGSIVTWKPVNDAVNYTVDVYDQSGHHVGTYSQWLLTYCNLVVLGVSSGTYTVTVTANGDGKYYSDSQPSAQSSAVTVTALDTPTVTVNAAGVASWTQVPNATAYEVDVLSGDETIAWLNQTQNLSCDLNTLGVPSGTNYVVQVHAMGGQKYADSNGTSTAFNFTSTRSALEKPDGLSVSNNVLSWNDVNGATTYDITVYDTNGNKKSGFRGWQGSSFDLSYLYNLPSGSYTATVTAFAGGSGYANSAPSNPVSFNYTASSTSPTEQSNSDIVQNVQVSGTTVKWSPVPNAAGYNLSVFRASTGEEVVPSVYTTSPSYDLSKDAKVPKYGDFVVLIAAAGTTDFGFATDVTSAEVSMGPAPSLQLTAPATPALQNNVLSWTPVAHATSYMVKIYDVSGNCIFRPVTDGTNSYTITMAGESGEYYASVTAIGDGITYADSVEGPKLEFSLQNLSVPQHVTTVGTVVSWDAVANVHQYVITVMQHGKWIKHITVDPTTAATMSLDLDSLGLDTGDYSISVAAAPVSGTLSGTSDAVSSAITHVVAATGLQATASPGHVSGSTAIAATPNGTDSLRVKVVDTKTGIVDVGSLPPADSQTYSPGSDVTGVSAGQYIDLYEVDANGKVVKFSEISLDATNVR